VRSGDAFVNTFKQIIVKQHKESPEISGDFYLPPPAPKAEQENTKGGKKITKQEFYLPFRGG
jgi:hypothetical protein